MAVKVGDIAPDFTLPAQNGTTVSLKDYRGQKAVVLYFYPKDDTPGCTAESCAFRDQYEVFKDAGAEVIGVSGDSSESHQKFAAKYNLPFILLSDKGDQVRKQYGATAAFGLFPGRVTYVIDQQGVVQYVFDSMLNFQGHVTEALKTLQTLSK
ncbi:peroxiredoxin [Nostoc sp. FACHB-87]|uniref:peroxiredoxin n=1 Tax=Nostocales TaxID=1161 RepID=UPI0016899863|nr:MULTISPECIES: peroxiredoxin [Nostocales]MBD2299882.1 peroxiredoxin [Nostoc sp. FACHB-190]MBD2453601.1 peroxiredoxin [Nostoc sp. FACHB-87]MBD2475727.1 peroxiredoxin [Anabaena sp. FACHB-83]MBD2492242.1 peroxiredoxin [Aulosira sp. FACHB-615]